MRIFIILFAALSVTAILIGPHVLGLISKQSLRQKIPILWHRFIAKLLGLDVRVEGKASDVRPLLLVSNHVSWKDIIVLGSVMPLSFIAKDEVRTWPVFGWLARLQRTVFVARDKKHNSGMQVSAITERLKQNDVMVLFAEGTTGDGNKLLPFKSSLIGAAQAAGKESGAGQTIIQPVAITYSHMSGIKLSHHGRVTVSWVGDQDLVPHLMERLKGSKLRANVIFGEPMVIDGASNRKQVTRSLEQTIAEMIRTSHHGAYKKAAEMPETHHDHMPD